MVLAHGGPGMSDNLRPLAAMIEDLATVHRYDQRACGRSTGRARGQTVASAIADLDALREHWGYERWIVGGHSWGAALALFYALSHSERTQAVIYISGPGLGRVANPSARPRMERLTAAEQKTLARAKGRAEAGDAAAAKEFAHLLWITDFADREKAPDFDLEPLFQYPHNAEVASALARSADEYLTDGTVREGVHKLAVPVLVLHGRDDPLPVEGAIELAGLLPRARLAIVEEVGHTLWLEDSVRVEHELRRLVAQVVR